MHAQPSFTAGGQPDLAAMAQPACRCHHAVRGAFVSYAGFAKCHEHAADPGRHGGHDAALECRRGRSPDGALPCHDLGCAAGDGDRLFCPSGCGHARPLQPEPALGRWRGDARSHCQVVVGSFRSELQRGLWLVGDGFVFAGQSGAPRQTAVSGHGHARCRRSHHRP